MRRQPVLLDIHGLPVVRRLGDLANYTDVPSYALQRAISAEERGLAYSVFELAKKSGGVREIASPHPYLKRAQRWILKNILERLNTTPHCHGFAPGSKLRVHAEQHMGARAVLTLDIKDFFSSISSARVTQVFRVAGYGRKSAWILSRLCTRMGSLPQGAPSSSRLANLVCFRMDRRLSQFANLRGLTYTRYADDLTFSSASMAALAKARSFLCHIIRDSGFDINRRKTRLVGPRGGEESDRFRSRTSKRWYRPTVLS